MNTKRFLSTLAGFLSAVSSAAGQSVSLLSLDPGEPPAAARPVEPDCADESASPSSATDLDASLASATALPARETPETAAYPNMYRTFEVSLGAAAYDNFDTTFQVTGDAGIGAVVDLEDTLGLDHNDQVFRSDMFYHFSHRHRVNFGYYDVGRSGSRTLTEDLQIGNVLFPAGSGVTTTLDTTIVKLSYQFNFVTDERTAIGASFGFHTMAIDAVFRTNSGNLRESFDVTAPLPVIGLHAEYALSPTWKLLASAEVFQIELDEFGGFLGDNRLSLEHNAFHNVGWGIGFNGFSLDANADGDDGLSADIEYAFQGLMLYLRGMI